MAVCGAQGGAGAAGACGAGRAVQSAPRTAPAPPLVGPGSPAVRPWGDLVFGERAEETGDLGESWGVGPALTSSFPSLGLLSFPVFRLGILGSHPPALLFRPGGAASRFCTSGPTWTTECSLLLLPAHQVALLGELLEVKGRGRGFPESAPSRTWRLPPAPCLVQPCSWQLLRPGVRVGGS